MLSKRLFASVMVCNDNTSLSNDIKEMCLEYYVVESETLGKFGDYNGKTYGIEIVKRETTKKNVIYMENELVSDVSCNEDYVKEVVGILSQYAVTPVTLRDILCDVIGGTGIKSKAVSSVA